MTVLWRLFIVLFLIAGNIFAEQTLCEFVLDNGLRVVYIKSSSQVALFSVYYRAGSINDKNLKSGVAHFCEHMAFEGNNKPFGDFLDDIGAKYNAFTSYELIGFYEMFDGKFLDQIAQYESVRMKHIKIDDESFALEKKTILEERNGSIDGDPEGSAEEVFNSIIFNRKPLGTSIIGWKHEIETISKEDICEYHKNCFVPNNAIIVIIGNFDQQHIKNVITKNFGDIPKTQISSVATSAIPNNNVKEITYKSTKNKGSVCIEYYYPFDIKTFKEQLILGLVISILNRPDSMAKKILKKMNIASGCSFIPKKTFPQWMLVVSIDCYDIDAMDNGDIMWHFCRANLLKHGIASDIFQKTKKQMLLSSAYEYDDISNIGMLFGYNLVLGYSAFEINKKMKILNDITLDECNDMLRRILTNPYCAKTFFLPKDLGRE